MKKAIILLPLLALFMSACNNGSSSSEPISSNPSSDTSTSDSSFSTGEESTSSESSLSDSSSSESTSTEVSPTSVKCLDVIYSYQSMEILDIDMTKTYTIGESETIEANFISIEEMNKTRLQVNELFYTFALKDSENCIGEATFVVPEKDFILAFTYYTTSDTNTFTVTFENTDDYIVLGLTSGEVTHQKMWFDVYPLKEGMRISTVTYNVNGKPEAASAYFTYEYWCMGYSFKTKSITEDITLHITIKEAETKTIDYQYNYGFVEEQWIDTSKASVPSTALVGRQIILYFPILETSDVEWAAVYFEDSDSFEILDFVLVDYFLFQKIALRMPNENITIYPCAYNS